MRCDACLEDVYFIQAIQEDSVFKHEGEPSPSNSASKHILKQSSSSKGK